MKLLPRPLMGCALLEHEVRAKGEFRRAPRDVEHEASREGPPQQAQEGAARDSGVFFPARSLELRMQ